MKYFLRNIAQAGSLRTILFIVLGLAIWVYAAVCGGMSWAFTLTAFLLIANAVQMAYLFSQLGVTNLISAFVAVSSFFLSSCLIADYSAWQGQVCVFGLQFILLVLHSGNLHEQMQEQAFLASLVVALLCFINPLCALLLLVVWGVLLIRHTMTLRVFLASLIAISLVVLYAAIFHRLSWLDASWLSVLARWNNYHPLWAIAIYAATAFILWLPLKRPSIATGIIYCLYLLSAAITYIFLSPLTFNL